MTRFVCMYVYILGPYFFGATPSIVDFTLVPWAYRYYVFETCRGPVQHLHLHCALTLGDSGLGYFGAPIKI